MKSDSKLMRLLMTLLLSLSMTVTYLPVSMIAYATDDSNEVITDTVIDDDQESMEASAPPEDVIDDEGQSSEDGEDGTAEDVSADEDNTADDVSDVEEAPMLRASSISEPSNTVLCFSSDTHNTSGNAAANRLGSWLDKVAAKHGGVTLMAFGGDMAGASASGYWDLTQADMNALSERNVEGVYTTGNHEISYGGDFKYSSYTSGSYSSTETKGQFEIDKEVASGKDYRVYCLGSQSSTQSYSNQITFEASVVVLPVL